VQPVFRNRHPLKVFYTVVKLVSVYVVDMFFAINPRDKGLRDKTMDQTAFAVPSYVQMQPAISFSVSSQLSDYFRLAASRPNKWNGLYAAMAAYHVSAIVIVDFPPFFMLTHDIPH
jgi:hypothetical protein